MKTNAHVPHAVMTSIYACAACAALASKELALAAMFSACTAIFAVLTRRYWNGRKNAQELALREEKMFRSFQPL